MTRAACGPGCTRWPGTSAGAGLHGDGASVPLTDDEFGAGEATADLGLALEQARQREMVSSALAELEPGDQEIVELHLRHEFYGADLADALGVPRNQVHTLTSRARTRFETALGAHMVARSRLGSCQELSWILGDWDGVLTPACASRSAGTSAPARSAASTSGGM